MLTAKEAQALVDNYYTVGLEESQAWINEHLQLISGKVQELAKKGITELKYKTNIFDDPFVRAKKRFLQERLEEAGYIVDVQEKNEGENVKSTYIYFNVWWDKEPMFDWDVEPTKDTVSNETP